MFVPHLHHQHRERKYIRLFAKCPSVEDLRCGPSHWRCDFLRLVPRRVLGFNDGSEAEVRDDCTTETVYEYV